MLSKISVILMVIIKIKAWIFLIISFCLYTLFFIPFWENLSKSFVQIQIIEILIKLNIFISSKLKISIVFSMISISFPFSSYKCTCYFLTSLVIKIYWTTIPKSSIDIILNKKIDEMIFFYK